MITSERAMSEDDSVNVTRPGGAFRIVVDGLQLAPGEEHTNIHGLEMAKVTRTWISSEAERSPEAFEQALRM